MGALATHAQNITPSPRGQSSALVPKACRRVKAAPAPTTLHLGAAMLDPIHGGQFARVCSPQKPAWACWFCIDHHPVLPPASPSISHQEDSGSVGT